MSKEESTVLKGVAILLMLFLHLFNAETLPAACHPLVFVGDVPLVHILTRAANPVPFFIILSGYGLAFVYERGNLGLRSQGKRLLKLYIHYWLILLIFVSIGCFVRPEKYPGDIWTVVRNVTSWNNSYNGELWFLFPYAVLSLTALYVFRLMDRMGNARSLILFFLVTMVSGYITSRYIAAYKLYDTMLARVLTYLGFLFCFSLGAVMCRMAKQGKVRIGYLEQHPMVTGFLLLLLVAFRCLFTTGAFNGIYVFLFIVLFLHLPLHRFVRSFLNEMGRHSMVMWMTHTFFCYYLFHDFIYGFRYPVFIYLVLLAVSYAVSIPIMWVAGWVIRRCIRTAGG